MNSAPRILIVEDDAILVVDLEATLIRMGYQVAGLVAAGQAAVAAAAAEQPDAILMDINLRGDLNGIQAAALIHQQADIPVIYLTAYTDDSLVLQAKATDAYAYLTKPVRERELRASLEMALYKHAAERRLQQLNQVLRAVRDVNQLITHERDPQRLLEEACQTLLRTRGYRLVWIGQPAENHLLPSARAGIGQDILEHILASATPEQKGSLPGSEAARTRQTVVCADMRADPRYAPWREALDQRQLRSTIAVPMLCAADLSAPLPSAALPSAALGAGGAGGAGLYGVLVVYADQVNRFDAEEADLLLELAADIAFGLKSIAEAAERRRAEAALRASEALFRAVVDNSHDGVVMMDRDRRVQYVSPSYERISGYTPADVVGTIGSAYIHPEDQALTAGVLREVSQTPGTSLSVEYRLRHKQGHWVWVETTATNLLADPQVRAVVLHSRDVSERKQAEAALRESEARFRALSEDALVGVYVIQAGRLTYVNPAMAAIFGYEPAVLIGGSVLTVVHPDDRALVAENTRRLAGEIRSLQYSFRGVRQDGQVRQVEVMGAQLELGGQAVIVGNIFDITERVRTAEALHIVKARLETLVGVSPLAIFMLDLEGRIELWNAAAEASFGWRAADILGQPNPIIPSVRQAEYARLSAQVLGGAPIANEETVRQRRDGSLLNVSLSSAAVYDSAGKLAGRMAIVADITERKRAEEAIARRNVELTALNQIGQALSRLAEPARILELVFAEIGRVLDNRNVFIALYDAAEQHLTFPVYTIQGERLVGRERPLGNGLTDIVIRTGTHILVQRDMPAALQARGIDLIGKMARSFLAVPLRAEERVLGVLAIQDYEREEAYDEHDVELLTTVAAQAASALENARLFGAARQELDERKRAEAELRQSQEQFRAVVQTANDAIITMDRQQRIALWNTAAENIFGFTAAEMLGQSITRIVPRQFRQQNEQAVERAFRRERTFTGRAFEVAGLNSVGQEFPIEMSLAEWSTQAGFFVTAVIRDIRDRKQAEAQIRQSLAEKETLLHELYHRTKNNMSVIIALLDLQAASFDDDRLEQAFRATRNRIRTMALVHEKLYEASDLSRINLKEYIGDLVALLVDSYSLQPGQAALQLELEDVSVLIDTAVPCGLILNELISNALRHAFPPGRAGRITVQLRQAASGAIHLNVADDGVGVPPGFDFRHASGMGLQNVFVIGERQLRGRVVLQGGAGVACRLEFTDNLYESRV